VLVGIIKAHNIIMCHSLKSLSSKYLIKFSNSKLPAVIIIDNQIIVTTCIYLFILTSYTKAITIKNNIPIIITAISNLILFFIIAHNLSSCTILRRIQPGP